MRPISGEDAGKVQMKSSKKSTKSRSKSSKLSEASTNAAKSMAVAMAAANCALVTTPTTPTNTTNPFDSSSAGTTDSSGGAATGAGSGSRSHKSYFGLEPRSVKIIWEQHDQSDVELAGEVCARLAEDASYKLWELINNIKIYARHSGDVVTYDLVNEVLRVADVPPTLGAMDSDWDRIDYDGSFFFYSDKIIELRDEFQKDVSITLPDGPDFTCTWPVEDKHVDLLKKYIPSLVHVALHGESDELDTALSEAAFSPFIGSCYRVILIKLIQVLAFKQIDPISARCWRLLRACTVNACTRDVHCREELFHLAEILICQLLGPYESIKVHSQKVAGSSVNGHVGVGGEAIENGIKMEIDETKLNQDIEMKGDFIAQDQMPAMEQAQEQETFQVQSNATADDEHIYKLIDDEDSEQVDVQQQFSPYFASPVEWEFVDELCQTIGQLAAINGFFDSECMHHIVRRLERFFEGRQISTEKEFNFISRAVRGLMALGDYAFREFIPFAYKLKADDVPELLWKDFAFAATYLNGAADIFLYEWLEHLCGTDKLQPFMIYYAKFHEKLLTYRFLRRKPPTFKINPKLGVRRLEWNSLAAAMCHGDDPNKALKPKPTINEVFPELIVPNLKLNRTGNIRFKFAGCRPVIIKSKTAASGAAGGASSVATSAQHGDVCEMISQSDILIARRKLFKPLSNERRAVQLSSYYFLRI